MRSAACSASRSWPRFSPGTEGTPAVRDSSADSGPPHGWRPGGGPPRASSPRHWRPPSGSSGARRLPRRQSRPPSSSRQRSAAITRGPPVAGAGCPDPAGTLLRVERAVLDHVALGTRDLADGWQLFGGLLGGTWAYGGDSPGYWWGQLQFARGPMIELLTPTGGPDAAFLERFLASRGAGPHHFNFHVPT